MDGVCHTCRERKGMYRVLDGRAEGMRPLGESACR